MNVAVVVPVFSPPEWISGLAASCWQQRAHVRLHLFLHSDAPTLAATCSDLSHHPDVVLYPYGTNRGLSRTWNDGMLQGYRDGADVVVITNDDVVFAPSDLDALASAAASDRERYIVSCAGPHGRYGCRLPSHGYACFAINPVALDRLGCFDQNFFPAYCEDQDYSRRAALAGLHEGNCANTNVFHAGSTAIFSDQDLRIRNSRTHALNMSYYRRKWGGNGDNERYRYPFNDPAFDYRIPPDRRERPYGPGYDRACLDDVSPQLRT